MIHWERMKNFENRNILGLKSEGNPLAILGKLSNLSETDCLKKMDFNKNYAFILHLEVIRIVCAKIWILGNKS